jgi:molybdate transport system regulatory protein
MTPERSRPDPSAAPLGATEVEVNLYFSNGGRLTDEDLRVIAAIRKERSILGASRATGLSYRKCWLIVDALNRTFEAPVFATFPGRRGGGAELTPFGERLVALYSSIGRRARTQARAALDEISAALNPNFARRSSDAAVEPEPGEWSSRLTRRP